MTLRKVPDYLMVGYDHLFSAAKMGGEFAGFDEYETILKQYKNLKEKVTMALDNMEKKWSLYQYCVVFFPVTKKDADESAVPELIVPITSVLAETEEQVRTIAARAIPEAYINKLTRTKTIIRSF